MEFTIKKDWTRKGHFCLTFSGMTHTIYEGNSDCPYIIIGEGYEDCGITPKRMNLLPDMRKALIKMMQEG